MGQDENGLIGSLHFERPISAEPDYCSQCLERVKWVDFGFQNSTEEFCVKCGAKRERKLKKEGSE